MSERGRTALRYVVGGLLIGGFWYLNRHRPPAEEALRTIGVFGLLLFVARGRLRRRNVELHLVPLLATKAALVIAAAAIEATLLAGVGHAPTLTAIGLGVAIAVLGPLLDRRFFSRPETPPQIG